MNNFSLDNTLPNSFLLSSVFRLAQNAYFFIGFFAFFTATAMRA